MTSDKENNQPKSPKTKAADAESVLVIPEESLFEKVATLIENSRRQVAKAANVAIVHTYFGIGKYIVDFEQDGKTRASYGKNTLERLSACLTEKFGKGWSYETLSKCRKFYMTYSILSAPQTKLAEAEKENLSAMQTNFIEHTNLGQTFTLSWNHYQILMRIENPDERRFYEIETQKQNWGYRWLQRQVASSLYERIALSHNKKEVMMLAEQGQIVEKPSDIIKNPVTLEFLGLQTESAYSESKLENAIIGKLQTFLLEMGKGFLFEARQKRFTFNEDNFYVDLVLYNRILQCYVLVDLKIDKLTHQDLGQMQMYVNYFDRYVKLEFEKPTIGILLLGRKTMRWWN